MHNGIIENYVEIRERLVKKGYKFVSETDSEVLAHLIEDKYKNNLEKAVNDALKEIQGYYALVVTSTDEPGKVVGARKDSPLVIGVGDSENFIASDITAFLKYTKRVVYLDENQITVLSDKKIKVFDENLKEIKKEENLISWDVRDAEKSGFEHFMLKEIYDQQDTVQHVIRGRVSEMQRTINFNEKIENLLD